MVNPNIKFWGIQIIVWLLSILLLSNIIGVYVDPAYLQRDYFFIFKGELTNTQIIIFGIFYLLSMLTLPYVTQIVKDPSEKKFIRYLLIFSYPFIYMFLTFVGMKTTGINLENVLNVSLIHFGIMFFVFFSVCILIYMLEARYLLERKLKTLKKIEDQFKKNCPFSKKGS
ncbi:hypothetical protein [Acinetobacter seifertii]|uniref:hypothetical protein n=1 Tax=Acinetobacter seifertii TaxID=1530123 RepID=UPI00124BE495|nr:hypothetical protein [Acinetobacter seifertii]